MLEKKVPLAIAAALVLTGILGGMSAAEIIQLRNGATINGRIIEQTPTLYRVELSPGAIISLSADEVLEVEKVEETSEIPELAFQLTDILPKPSPKAVSADLNLATFESKLDKVKTLDDLIQDGKGVPRITTQAQLAEARKRKLPVINLLGQMFYLSPEGRYLAKEAVSAIPTVYAATDTEVNRDQVDMFKILSGYGQEPETGAPPQAPVKHPLNQYQTQGAPVYQQPPPGAPPQR